MCHESHSQMALNGIAIATVKTVPASVSSLLPDMPTARTITGTQRRIRDTHMCLSPWYSVGVSKSFTVRLGDEGDDCEDDCAGESGAAEPADRIAAACWPVGQRYEQ